MPPSSQLAADEPNVRSLGAVSGVSAGLRIGWTAWDTRVFGRSAAAAVATNLLACLVTAATDEGGVSWGERAGRTLPLAPLCAAVGVVAGLVPALWRGETTALAALGRMRVQLAAGAVLGGGVIAVIAALLMGCFARVDVAGFYPIATHASSWRWDGGAFVDRLHGLTVGADGMPQRIAAEVGTSVAPLPAHARLAAALTTAIAGVALALLSAHLVLSQSAPSRTADRTARPKDRWAVAATVGALAGSVVLFQAAAAHRLPAIVAVVPALALLGLAVFRYRAAP